MFGKSLGMDIGTEIELKSTVYVGKKIFRTEFFFSHRNSEVAEQALNNKGHVWLWSKIIFD
jgi:hypothetical protein